MTLALAPSDTTEMKSLVTYKGAQSFEILQRDHVDFTVSKRPMYLSSGIVVPNNWAVVRDDNQTTLGVVGNVYRPLQNQLGLDLFDAAAASGQIEYGKAGTFKSGAIVWMQIKLPGSLKVGPDEVARYLLLANSHNGTSNLRILLTPIRVVCRNTLAMALSDKESGMKIRHTSGGSEKVKLAQRAIEDASRYYTSFQDVANVMYRKQLTPATIKTTIAEIFPAIGEDKEVSTRLENTRNQVIDLVERGQGQYEIRGTAWGVYNAVAEYTDHHRSTRGDEANRLESAWLGSGAAMKRRAFEILTRT